MHIHHHIICSAKVDEIFCKNLAHSKGGRRLLTACSKNVKKRMLYSRCICNINIDKSLAPWGGSWPASVNEVSSKLDDSKWFAPMLHLKEEIARRGNCFIEAIADSEMPLELPMVVHCVSVSKDKRLLSCNTVLTYQRFDFQWYAFDIWLMFAKIYTSRNDTK